MKNFVTFDNAKEMLDFINDNHDLYCEETSIYVANYNDYGGIVTYYLTAEDAMKCEKYREETGDYWLGCLGPGGDIYDDPLYHKFERGQMSDLDMSNLDFCEENYKNLWFVIC